MNVLKKILGVILLIFSLLIFIVFAYGLTEDSTNLKTKITVEIVLFVPFVITFIGGVKLLKHKNKDAQENVEENVEKDVVKDVEKEVLSDEGPKYKTYNKKNISQEQIDKLNKVIEKIKKKKGIPYYKINIVDNSDSGIFDSKLGGIPYWDFNKEYPKGLCLLAQINFEKEQLDNDLLPKSGMLQFFIEPDELLGLNFKNGFDIQDKWKVVYHEKIDYSVDKDNLKNMNVPSNTNLDKCIFPFDKEYKMEFIPDIDCSGMRYYKANEELCDILVKLNYSEDIVPDFMDNFTEEEQDYLYERLNAFDHKLLGYPDFAQVDPRFDGSGYEEYDTLLFQLDSKDGIMWGDSGICNFFINRNDLKNKDFSKVLYNWDCY